MRDEGTAGLEPTELSGEELREFDMTVMQSHGYKKEQQQQDQATTYGS